MKLREITDHLRLPRFAISAFRISAFPPTGRYELRGGTPDDRQAAREWISMFLHHAAVNV